MITGIIKNIPNLLKQDQHPVTKVVLKIFPENFSTAGIRNPAIHVSVLSKQKLGNWVD